MSMTHVSPGPKRWGILIFLFATVFAVSAAGSWATLPKIPTWYAGLTKPGFNPPSWVFGPVWTALYAMMAVAAWRVWTAAGADGAARQMALAFWWMQLLLNAIWSPVFFGLERPGAALIVIVALWLAIAATTMRFFRIDRLAGWLFVPYLCWVSFATMLNGAIFWLNR